MDEYIQQAYLDELHAQGSFVLLAVRGVNEAFSKLKLGDFRFLKDIFRNIHSLLTHCSNISRLLWPPKPLKKKKESKEAYNERSSKILERGQALREIFADIDIEILKDRTLRDHLEHFDERLFDWQEMSAHHNISQDNIGPIEAFGGTDAIDSMRHFDPQKATFYFRRNAYQIQPLISAVELIMAKISSLKAKG